jgi:hypothetical protein
MQTLTKFKISGKTTNAYNKMERINADDVDGHMVSLLVAEGVNVSTGNTAFMDGAQVVTIATSDMVNFNGTFQGYTKFMKKGDTTFSKVEGKVTGTPTAEGNLVVLLEGTITFSKGTGQFENIQGSSSFKGRYLTNILYIIEWEGEYWINK